jgi:thiamine pyrophosphate-dependent acetolactate synthase large subunit-like protein
MNAPRTSSLHAEVPTPSPAAPTVWGSDAMAAMLRALDVPFVALNPGASYRGLHDSLVNHLGNERPQMILCLHEDNAVAIAHGYAKASGKMMGAALHSNVGLLHGSMSIFNAWCDRVPMLILGATGPWDAAQRRPWIDWIHTVSDQGALIRDFTKWDNQPASIPAMYEAVARGVQIANTAPCGPVYINLDAALQEAKLDALPPVPDVARYRAPNAIKPDPALVAEAARLLSQAKNPIILIGRTDRTMTSWRARVALAEKLNARVFTDIKCAAAFPTDHPLQFGWPGIQQLPPGLEAIRKADVILALDCVDIGGMLKQAFGNDPITAKVIRVSLDQHSHRGFGMEYHVLPPADCYLLCEPEAAVPMLLDAVTARPGTPPAPVSGPQARVTENVTIASVAHALNEATRGLPTTITHLPLGWHGAYRHFKEPLDFLGANGGAGVGAGPGITVGAGLALMGSGRLTVGVLGDGDFLMSNTAVWTAAHYKIPCLMIMANNRSFYNDELHQERVARTRGRPTENKWIGQRINEPDIDLAMMARAQGAEGIGPVTRPDELPGAIKRGIEAVQQGKVCIIDARVAPGYDTDATGGGAAIKRGS